MSALRRRRPARSTGIALESRVCDNTERLLGIFEDARRHGDVLRAGLGRRAISGARRRASRRMGHEVASHGYAHRLIYDQTPAAFREDVRRAKATAGVGGGLPRRRIPRAELLDHAAARCGRSMSSSRKATATTPASFRFATIATAFRGRRGIRTCCTRESGSLVEAPGRPCGSGPLNLPVAGGGYFRILPVSVDALGHRAAQRARATAGDLLPASVGGRPGSAPVPGRVGSAGSGTTGTSTRPKRACAGCWRISGSRLAHDPGRCASPPMPTVTS